MTDYQIMYQNSRTGESWDITSLVSKPNWQTYRRGSPASLDMEVVKWQEIDWQLGSRIILKSGKLNLFAGYLVKIRRNEKMLMSLLAYDQIFYLKQQKAAYKLDGKRADQVIKMIADDFKLKTGNLANTDYVIPKRDEDGQTLIDICLMALDLTLINTGKMFYLWDDFGALRISNVEDDKLQILIGDNSIATGFIHEQDIESDTYNQIKLVKDDAASGGRKAWVLPDSNHTDSLALDNQRLWGLLQYWEKVDEGLNDAQIEERARNLIQAKNRPRQSLVVNAIADLTVRAGKMVLVRVKELGLSTHYVVDECTHDLQSGFMSLRLKVM